MASCEASSPQPVQFQCSRALQPLQELPKILIHGIGPADLGKARTASDAGTNSATEASAHIAESEPGLVSTPSCNLQENVLLSSASDCIQSDSWAHPSVAPVAGGLSQLSVS